jgi:hypothetical protein
MLNVSFTRLAGVNCRCLKAGCHAHVPKDTACHCCRHLPNRAIIDLVRLHFPQWLWRRARISTLPTITPIAHSLPNPAAAGRHPLAHKLPWDTLALAFLSSAPAHKHFGAYSRCQLGLLPDRFRIGSGYIRAIRVSRGPSVICRIAIRRMTDDPRIAIQHFGSGRSYNICKQMNRVNCLSHRRMARDNPDPSLILNGRRMRKRVSRPDNDVEASRSTPCMWVK